MFKLITDGVGTPDPATPRKYSKLLFPIELS